MSGDSQQPGCSLLSPDPVPPAMPPFGTRPEPRALRAPREDGAVVADPPLNEVGALLSEGASCWESTRPVVFGQDWMTLRQRARQDTLQAARRYMAECGEPVPELLETDRWLVAGHQPELFHPGVWVKNFALAGLAHQHSAIAVNLVVDNDTVKNTGLRMPTFGDGGRGEPSSPALVRIPFDLAGTEAPWEERTIVDREWFHRFDDRIKERTAGWGYEPLLYSFWAEVRMQTQRTPLMGECFAAARRAKERAWGCHNLEVPLSALCRTESFAWFACHLLAELPRLHGLYNACVWDYRARHGLRSQHHPVPDLASATGGWREVPLWGWRAGTGDTSTRRGRVFARLCHDRIELRVGEQRWPDLPLPSRTAPEECVRAYQQLEADGYKIRTRALTTTLFARLFLADVFVHGLGGGKYDEMTDELMRRFHGLEPPRYLILSATRLLPFPSFSVEEADRKRLAHQLRDLHFNPQRHLGTLTEEEPYHSWVQERQAWVDKEPPTRAGRRQRYRALRALNARLRAPLEEQQTTLREELRNVEQQTAANAVLRRRDYSFCLYPEAELREFCRQFL